MKTLRAKLNKAKIAQAAFNSRMEELQGEMQQYCEPPIVVYETTDSIAVSIDSDEYGMLVDSAIELLKRKGKLNKQDFYENAVL